MGRSTEIRLAVVLTASVWSIASMGCAGIATDASQTGSRSGSGGQAAEIELEPLDTRCPHPVCHVLLRLNAKTLEVLGYGMTGAPFASIGTAQALQIAEDQIHANTPQYSPTVTIESNEAELYLGYAAPGDFGGFALVGEESGTLIASGGIIWSGQGAFWTPTDWRPASDVQLGSTAVTPDGSEGHAGDCKNDVAPRAEARERGLRSNLAFHLAKNGAFSLFTYLYTPTVGWATVGGCNPDVAEYLLVFTQQYVR